MIFTNTAAKRLLTAQGIHVTAILRVIRLPFVICVVYRVLGRGVCATFISRRAFKAEFVRFRKESAQAVKIRRVSGVLLAQSSDSDSEYEVELNPVQPRCQCRDFEKQAELLPQQCCKHIYAAIGLLGYASLGEWVAAGF